MTDKDPKQCRIRRTNAFGEGLGRPCESEAATLSKDGISNGALVFLEDGIVLKKVFGMRVCTCVISCVRLLWSYLLRNPALLRNLCTQLLRLCYHKLLQL